MAFEGAGVGTRRLYATSRQVVQVVATTVNRLELVYQMLVSLKSETIHLIQ